jgi:uncharacterized protein YbaP (TraB family)
MKLYLLAGSLLSFTAAGAPAQHLALKTSASPTHAATPQYDRQMLFRATGPNGGTVFLLGSVHLLSEEAGKLPKIVDSVFEVSKTVAFETSIDSLQMRGFELFAKASYPKGQTLHSQFSPGSVARLDSLLAAYGLPAQQVDGYKPWFVSLLFTQSVMKRANFSAQYGVDAQINGRARAAGKTMIGLEPVDAQLGLFDNISEADQELMVLKSVGPDSSAHMLMEIKEAWQTGDAATLDRLLNRGLKDCPGLFAALVTNRNTSWIPKIEKLLQGQDDALVVVGAAHLVGKQGVVEMLRAKGYAVQQM